MTLAADAPEDTERRPARTAAGPGRQRLLFVVNDAGYFLSHRAPIAAAAAAGGWEVHVAVPASTRCREIAALGATVHAITMSRAGVHPLETLRTTLELLALCRRLRPEVVHLIALKAVALGGTAARLAGVRNRVFAIAGLGHVFAEPGPRSRLVRTGFRLLLPWLVGRSGRLIVQNDTDLDRAGFTDSLARRALLIPGSGVDLEAFRPAPEPEGPFTVVLPARMIRPKGIADFVEAGRRLKAAGRAVRLQLAGTTDPGNPESIPQAELAAWHAEGAVAWLGHCAEMPEVFARAHAVCLPSYYGEGVPKCLLEAAAAGRPVVTTDMPGCRAAIRPEETGLLVPPRDPEALAAALARLAEDPELRTRLGRAGRALAERRFGVDGVIRRHLELYREVAG